MSTMHLVVLLLPLALCLATAAVRCLYNVFFHPLRHYPGPLACRASFLYWLWVQCRGESHRFMRAMHDQYGDVVRIEPNLLSYTDSRAWNDIYGHRSAQLSRTDEPANGNLPKSKWAMRSNADGSKDILNGSEADHRRMRRLETHMFSSAALAGQEPLIAHYVNGLVASLATKAAEPRPVVDLVMWYNFTTFDILGALAFGEDFGCLQHGHLHPWVANIFYSLKDSFFQRTLNRLPWPLNRLAYQFWVEKKLTHARKEEFDFATQKAKARLARGIQMEKHDFMSYMLRYNDERGMTEDEIMSNSSVLIIAGSETTAVYLAGVTYNLLKDGEVMQKLTGIIRSTFASEHDITLQAVAQIPYLAAVIAESGRLYPAVPSASDRQTTQGGNTICGRVLPEGTTVHVHHWATYTSAANFTDPDKFVPERWLKDPPARYANDNLTAFQPFSVGPRACIGRNLAMAELRLILARMLWNFDMKLSPDSLDWMTCQKVYNVWEKKPLLVEITRRPGI